MLNTKLVVALAVFGLLGTGGVSARGIHPAISGKQQSTQRTFVPSRGADLLYGQTEHDNVVGIVAQNFEPEFDIYDTEAADDAD